ncbi:MAG: DNA polymerase III subunit gamma/tau [Xenococcaceae cyanobacterium]
MSYEPLHHKYRPQTFADLVGQSAIATTLSSAIEQNKIAPAYLFTGPRGTGKTSSARILAKSLNCLSSDRPTSSPCGKCEVCKAIAYGSALDVMEIDAASNTGVDNIREIIERCQFAPVQSRYKVYAIDECHMLSTAAFNALLKTLEEPPDRVVFVLATTDPQRVLPTIISRCQRFDFRRIPLAAMGSHLKYIATQENINIDEAAITLVAQIANGGLRDAESLLDQLSILPGKITVEQVWDLVGSVPEQDLLALLKAIAANRPEVVIELSRNLFDRGREPLVILQNLAGFYLNLLIAKTAANRSDLTAITETTWQDLCLQAQQWDTREILRGQQHLKNAEVQIKNTTQPRLWLEVTLLGLLPSSSSVYPGISVAGSLNQEKQERDKTQIVSPISSQTKISNKVVSINSIPNATNHKNNPADALVSPKKEEAISSRKVTVPTQPVGENIPETPVEKGENISPQEIWEKAIAHSQPPTTQALFKQKCHLISLHDAVAIVGISSPQLLKLNQGKIPNLEAAFAKACQRNIKVKLEAVSSTKEISSATEVTPSSLQSPVEPTESFIPEKKTLNPEISQQNNNVVVEAKPQATQNLQEKEPQQVNNFKKDVEIIDRPVEKDSIDSAEAQVNISKETNEQNFDLSYPEEKLQLAIDNLVKNFEGELIDSERFFNNKTTEAEELKSEHNEIYSSETKLNKSEHKPKRYISNNRPNLSDFEDEEDVPF